LAGQSLANSELEKIDLTPGNDPWKERFATEHDSVYELKVWRTELLQLKVKLRNNAMSKLRSLLKIFRLQPSRLRSYISLVRRINLQIIWHAGVKLLPQRVEYRVYRVALETLPEIEISSTFPEIQIDAFNHLVNYRPVSKWQTRQRFLQAAMDRIERGEKFYSASADENLLHYGWLIPRQSRSFFAEVKMTYEYPEPGAVLYDFYTHPNARDRGLYQHTLRRMLQDLKQNLTEESKPHFAYISVLEKTKNSHQVIEKFGFKYIESLVRVSALGFSHRYRLSAKHM